MSKQFYILLLMLTFFFITPGKSYACGSSLNKTEKSCCKKDNDIKRNSKACDSTCDKLICKCTTVQSIFFVIYLTELNADFIIIKNKKEKSFYNKIELSPGYFSIWTPPKIT